MLRLIFALLRFFRRSAVLLTVVALLALNVATLTIASVNAAVSGALFAATGISTVAQTVRLERAKTIQTVKRVRARTARTTARGLATVPMKSAPFIGAAAVTVLAAHDLASACAVARDLEAVGGDATDEGDDQVEGQRAFCKQNAERLDALAERIDPLLDPLDPAIDQAWQAATNVISLAEHSIETLSDWLPRREASVRF